MLGQNFFPLESFFHFYKAFYSPLNINDEYGLLILLFTWRSLAIYKEEYATISVRNWHISVIHIQTTIPYLFSIYSINIFKTISFNLISSLVHRIHEFNPSNIWSANFTEEIAEYNYNLHTSSSFSRISGLQNSFTATFYHVN